MTRWLAALLVGAGTLLGGPVRAEAPFFPFGVYDKSDPYNRFGSQVAPLGSDAWQAHRERFAALLARYELNTVVNTAYREHDIAMRVLDSFHAQGIRVIFRPGRAFNDKSDGNVPGYARHATYRHPAVMAVLLGDEPKKPEQLENLKWRYEQVRKVYRMPVVTAMIGELMGPEGDTPLAQKGETDDLSPRFWRELDASVLLARYYPLRRAYDLFDWYEEKARLPFPAFCAEMEARAAGRPWWYVAQLFGKGRERTQAAYWRLPTASEVEASVHVALAHGVRGIVGWSIPAFDSVKKPTRLMAIDEQLQPVAARDGSFPIDGFARMARLAKTHAAFLLAHTPAPFTAEADNPRVHAAARQLPGRDGAAAASFLYVVNLDGDNPQRAKVRLTGTGCPALGGNTELQDLFDGHRFDASPDGACAAVGLKLAPGQGVLLPLPSEAGR